MGSNVEGRAARGERAGHLDGLGNGLAIGAILSRAGVAIQSFEHGDTLPQEDGHGLLVEMGLY